MIGKSIYKVPEGKLVKISLEFENNKINSVKITGDFFLYPEDGLKMIEQGLAGAELSEQEIVKKINETVHGNNLELFGLNPEGVTKAILMAMENLQ